MSEKIEAWRRDENGDERERRRETRLCARARGNNARLRRAPPRVQAARRIDTGNGAIRHEKTGEKLAGVTDATRRDASTRPRTVTRE